MSSSKKNWRNAAVCSNISIGQAIRNLDEVAIKIILVVDAEGVLEGTVTDGDIRRGLLNGFDMNSPISCVIHRNALVVPPELEQSLVMQLMVSNKIQQIPVVDEQRRVVGLHLWDEIVSSPTRQNLMVIMAGGKGTRLRPHTENCPKPMLSVAGKPMLEHIIDRAKQEGFNHFVLAIHYLGHMIESYFGNGENFGVQISYVREEFPLGTAGALSLLDRPPNEAFIVTNGDVMTDIRYGEMLDFHERQAAAATMAVHLHEWQYQFGVVQTQGLEIVGFEEKPVMRSHVNAGDYAISPEALKELAVDE